MAEQQPQLRIEKLLREMVNRGASDLHLRVGVRWIPSWMIS